MKTNYPHSANSKTALVLVQTPTKLAMRMGRIGRAETSRKSPVSPRYQTSEND
jgi:hypothetical protein